MESKMSRDILRILGTFIMVTLIMSVAKIGFGLGAGDFSMSQIFQAMWHGLSMDMSMAGYLTVIPAILTIIGIGKITSIFGKCYFAIIAFLMSLGLICNVVLYTYWGFPLDTTPLFYIISSPQAAMASMEWWMYPAAIIGVGLVTWGIYLLLCWTFFRMPRLFPEIWKCRWLRYVVLTVMTAALFIPIRGGVTVSTMNVSRAYFSDNMAVNHMAVNPLFNFMYSATHQTNFRQQFRFMTDEEAEMRYSTLYNYPESSYFEPLDSVAPPYQPDIQLIILESFSSKLLPSQGGEPIAMRLDSLGQEGWLFKNIYASSFRTDRALPAVLNGYPAQPTISLMKWVNKLDSLPAIGRSLKDVGYSTAYFYGGDVNFTNMNALLIAGGFDKIIKDKDFPISERLSKWGVHDDVLYKRALEYAKTESDGPRFTVVQTSSSHEPFEVPYQSHLENKRANAFAYADSCLGDYIDSLRTLPSWDRTLVVMIPDHWGAYPRYLEDHKERHHVPLVMVGGALDDIRVLNPSIFDMIGSQLDIAHTLVFLAGGQCEPFKFSHNLLDPCRRPYAMFSEPSWAALITNHGLTEISVESNQVLQQTSSPEDLPWLQAFLQILYNDIDAR